MSLPRFNLRNLKEIAVPIIGLALVLLLLDMRSHQNGQEDRVNRAIANDCRVLVVLKQPIDPSGPCKRPEILEIYGHLPACDLEDIVLPIIDPSQEPVCPPAVEE